MYADVSGLSDPKTLDAALADFLEQLPGNAVKAKRALIAFLKTHPDALATLQGMIADEMFSDDVLVHILFSIAKTASPEAQKMMADLIENKDLSLSTRLRVIFSVAEVPVATPNLVAAIREGSSRLKDPRAPMDDLASTSLLTAGILARNAIDIAPDIESELKADILDILQNHPDPAVKANVLDAIGNYGNAELAPVVAEYINASSEVERIAAAKALVYLPSEGRERLLIDRLRQEERGNVRLTLAKSLAATGISTPEAVQVVAAKLLNDQEPTHRAAAIKVLGQAAERLPEARIPILDHVTNEADPLVLESAGRFLSAYELHTMRTRKD